METLGQVLKSAREKLNKTLRDVQESTGISNPYLSQLENDKIKNPSANMLYKLSSVYELELDSLLAAAGIIVKKKETKQTEAQKKIAFYADRLNSDEEKEVLDFIEYLKYKKKND